ncbi:hypothetical protein [Pectobacterium carotovorum]|uniref:hypothetical protein n=1 Tax=Pectobacterium carotovorum TaxID=554 RepID=UPI000313125D|nr:hypothetical protein [Pectobacterium carotovorum]
MKSENLGDIDFYEYIIEFYDRIKKTDIIENIKLFQLSVIELLFSKKHKIKEIPINDINKDLINPEFFY